MIWVGRIFSIPLGIVFFVLLLATLIVLQVNDSFLNADYYPEELRRADVYEFVLVDLLTSALDERRVFENTQASEDIGETPLLSSGLTTGDIAASVNKAVPPEWVQGLVEQSFDQFGRYLTGERDEFAFTLTAGEQATILVGEVKGLMRKADAYNLLYDEVLTPRVEESLDFELPLGVQVSAARLMDAIREIAPPDWVQEQVEGVLDEVTPYIVGERDTFEVRVQLVERVEIALQEVKALLGETDAYELLYAEVVEPKVLDALGEQAQLPFGVSVTGDEVVDALRQVAPPAWVGEQVEALIDDVGPYLTGRSDSFATEVSLVDNKRQARRVLVELVDRRLTETIEAIDECSTAGELRAAASTEPGQMPGCLPPNVSTRDVIERLSLDLGDEVDSRLLARVPDMVVFDNARLRDTLVQVGAGDNLERVDEVREIFRDGYVFTDADLRERLADQGENYVERLDDLRSFLSVGWTYTETRFREDIAGEPGAGGAATLDNMDTFRDGMKLARTFRLVIYVPLLVLLVVIAFMGGRGWAGRVAYAAGCLLISGGIIFAIFGPGYTAFAKTGPIYDTAGVSDLQELRRDALNDITEGGGDFPNTARLAANKAFDTVESIADGFASGIAGDSLTLAMFALAIMVAAIFWGVISGMIDRSLPDESALRRYWKKSL